MKTQRTQHGFTIVELLATMAASSILCLTAGLMLYYGYQCWARTGETVDVHRDGAVSMKMFAAKIRRATAVAVWEEGAHTDVLRIVSSGVTNEFYRAGNDLVYCPDIGAAENTMTLVGGSVQDFTIDVFASGVRVQLTLLAGDGQMAFDTITGYRN